MAAAKGALGEVMRIKADFAEAKADLAAGGEAKETVAVAGDKKL